MLPFKFFHCGKVGHFSSKCPFKESNTMKKEEKARINLGNLIFFLKEPFLFKGRIKTTLQRRRI
jgi:hypothetical protein